MFAPISRTTHMHVCPMQTPAVVPIPHVGGPVVGPGAPTVLAGGIPVSVVGDVAVCVGPPDVLAMGSPTVLAMGRPVVRCGDLTAHGGNVIPSFPSVWVGDSGGAGGAQAATMKAAKAGGSAFARSECAAEAAAAVARRVPPPPPDTGTSWVEVEVVDHEGKPLPYQKIRVTDSAGFARIAFTDANGVIRMNGIARGECMVTLPDLDRAAWQPC